MIYQHFCKIIILAFWGMLNSQNAYAQTTCDCRADLDFAYSLIKKTPSYKGQIRGAKKQSFEAHAKDLRQKAGKRTPLYECFQLLVDLLAPIRDNHIYFRSEGKKIKQADLYNPIFIKTFKQSPVYQLLPEVDLDLVALEKRLKQKSMTELEGVYYYREIIKMGVVKMPGEDSYQGIILQSVLPSWEPGQVIMVMKPIHNQRFEVISASFISRTLLHFQERIGPGALYTYGWSKITNTKPHYQRIYSEETYDLLAWNDQVQYLRIGSFSSNTANVKKARKFVSSLERKLKAPHLVIDLRGNSGGARKVSLPFFKILKRYQQNSKIWVLTNFATVSNAEQFTAKLKTLNNVTILGMTTNGTLSYGRNFGGEDILPSGYFSLKTTDMNFSKFLKYEEKGIQPDVPLDPDIDWKKQVMAIINK